MDKSSPILKAFPPLGYSDAETLILGSMPGVASLDALKYYAHPQNAFWPIINDLYGDPATDIKTRSYADKKQILKDSKLALWDVVVECRREGSLDSKIDRSSVRCNNFTEFLNTHQRIVKIAFNGKTAEQLFRKQVLPTLGLSSDIVLITLPSSSPAMATLSRQKKTDNWRSLLLN